MCYYYDIFVKSKKKRIYLHINDIIYMAIIVLFMVMKYFHYSNSEINFLRMPKKNQQHQHPHTSSVKKHFFAIYMIVNIQAKACIKSFSFLIRHLKGGKE